MSKLVKISQSPATSAAQDRSGEMQGKLPRPSGRSIGEYDDAQEKLRHMEKSLRRKSKKPYSGLEYYIPINSLEAIVNRDTIRPILPALVKNVDEKELDAYADVICPIPAVDDELSISYRKVLAILILIKKPDKIGDFVNDNISDDKLPLRQIGKERPFKLGITEKLGPDLDPAPLACFDKWEDNDIESFHTKQYEMLAPIFSREVDHYEMTVRHPLPYTKEPGQPSRDMEGGSGKVTGVRVHPAHYSLPLYTGGKESPVVAIKELKSDSREAFDDEVAILKRLSTNSNPHLVKLILTMETIEDDKKFYLMFPYANGNLRGFWHSKNPHSGDPLYVTYSSWVARQCRGLVAALHILHDLRKVSVGDSSAEPDQSDRYHGIHGDIKPENLLWYENWNGYADAHHNLGVIQLADFGITTVHGPETVSEVKVKAHTKTYSPPEVELGYTVGRSFDIWGLGCVFLEFLLWLIKGNARKTTDEFLNARKKENSDEEGFFQYTFYQLKHKKAGVHPAVENLISELRGHARCSEFIVDFIRIIKYEMLVVEKKIPQASDGKEAANSYRTTSEKKRITSKNLEEKLNRIIQTSDKVSKYFVGGKGKKKRVPEEVRRFLKR